MIHYSFILILLVEKGSLHEHLPSIFANSSNFQISGRQLRTSPSKAVISPQTCRFFLVVDCLDIPDMTFSEICLVLLHDMVQYHPRICSLSSSSNKSTIPEHPQQQPFLCLQHHHSPPYFFLIQSFSPPHPLHSIGEHQVRRHRRYSHEEHQRQVLRCDLWHVKHPSEVHFDTLALPARKWGL